MLALNTQQIAGYAQEGPALIAAVRSYSGLT
jgi:hypothetical protein